VQLIDCYNLDVLEETASELTDPRKQLMPSYRLHSCSCGSIDAWIVSLLNVRSTRFLLAIRTKFVNIIEAVSRTSRVHRECLSPFTFGVAHPFSLRGVYHRRTSLSSCPISASKVKIPNHVHTFRPSSAGIDCMSSVKAPF
jgi:hypothetical protein